MTDTTDTAALREFLMEQIDHADSYGGKVWLCAEDARLAMSSLDQLEAERQRADDAVTERNKALKQASAARNELDKATADIAAMEKHTRGVEEALIAATDEIAALKVEQVPVDDLKAEIKAPMRTYALVSSPSTMAAAHEAGYAFVKSKGFNRILAALFTAPQKPVVLSFEQWLESKGDKPLGWVREAMKEAYNAAIESAGGIVKDGE